MSTLFARSRRLFLFAGVTYFLDDLFSGSNEQYDTWEKTYYLESCTIGGEDYSIGDYYHGIEVTNEFAVITLSGNGNGKLHLQGENDSDEFIYSVEAYNECKNSGISFNSYSYKYAELHHTYDDRVIITIYVYDDNYDLLDTQVYNLVPYRIYEDYVE